MTYCHSYCAQRIAADDSPLSALAPCTNPFTESCLAGLYLFPPDTHTKSSTSSLEIACPHCLLCCWMSSAASDMWMTVLGPCPYQHQLTLPGNTHSKSQEKEKQTRKPTQLQPFYLSTWFWTFYSSLSGLALFAQRTSPLGDCSSAKYTVKNFLSNCSFLLFSFPP